MDAASLAAVLTLPVIPPVAWYLWRGWGDAPKPGQNDLSYDPEAALELARELVQQRYLDDNAALLRCLEVRYFAQVEQAWAERVQGRSLSEWETSKILRPIGPDPRLAHYPFGAPRMSKVRR